MASADFPPAETAPAAMVPAGEARANVDLSFADAAGRVRRRLFWRRMLLVLLKTWLWAALGLGALIAMKALMGGVWNSLFWGAGLVSSWLLSAMIVAWTKRPGEYHALAYWDERAGRSDAFANAWWLVEKKRGSNGEMEGAQLHVRRQQRLLVEALKQLPRDIPLPKLGKLAVPLLMVLAVVVTPAADGGLTREPELSSEARRAAEAEGRKLAEREMDASKMSGLTEVEKEEVKQIQQKVDQTARSLQKEGSQSAREVLAELEKRARDAERIAEKLGAGDMAWASDQMVTEMRQHADTAELGDAVAAKSADKTAIQADSLAGLLSDKNMVATAQERFVETFKEIGAAAQPEDPKRTVGQHVVATDKHLTQDLMADGAAEMRALADKMRTLAQREKAREQLEELAQQLRDSGSKIANEGRQGGMQELTGKSQQNGGDQDREQQDKGQGQGQGMTAMPNAQDASPMQMPGMSLPDGVQGQGQSGQQMQTKPMSQQDMQNLQQMQVVPNPNPNPDGANGPSKNQPMLIAPVPGKPSTDKPPEAVIMMGGTTPGSSLGGLQAGQSKAGLNEQNPSAKTEAGQSGMVNAQRNQDGLSSSRTVEGQVRKEEAARSAQETAMEAIAAEETALDDSALPAARREQVRRYFNELRRRFEQGS